ncbi:MAG: hypothetical protein M3353_04215 [Actinomycetota bacterium]|nr:hypothetical protein [Actinomycetota bacterium]
MTLSTVTAHVGASPVEEIGALAGLVLFPVLVLTAVVLVVRRLDRRAAQGR